MNHGLAQSYSFTTKQGEAHPVQQGSASFGLVRVVTPSMQPDAAMLNPKP